MEARIKIRSRVVGILLTVAGFALSGLSPAQADEESVDPWNRATVYVVNQLDPSWPVAEAAEAWDAPARLDLIIVDRCPVRRPSCITVRRGHLPSGALGETWTDRDDLGRYRQAVITISDLIVPDYDAALKLLLVRHELGHAVGSTTAGRTM